MEEEKKDSKNNCCVPKKWNRPDGGFGGFYFFAMIGAAVYNVQQVSGFWPIVLEIIKAFFWPAFLIHRVFTLLGM